MRNNTNYYPMLSDFSNSNVGIDIELELGIKGFGMLFLLKEFLSKQENGEINQEKLEKFGKIKKFSKKNFEKLLEILKNHGEIIEKNGKITDVFLNEHFQIRAEKSRKARESVQKRRDREAKNNSTIVRDSYNERGACSPTIVLQGKERKGKEIKEKENKEKIKEKNTKKEKTETEVDLSEYGQGFVDVFFEFQKMRKQIKKPMTKRAKELLLMKLKKMGGDNEETQIKLMEQSILKGWQDVYDLKPDFVKNKSSPSGGGFGDINANNLSDNMKAVLAVELARQKRKDEEKARNEEVMPGTWN